MSPRGAAARAPEPPRLAISVAGAEVDRAAATPTLALRLEVASTDGRPVASALLHCQVRITPRRRSYDADTRRRLVGLYGPGERWGETLRDLLWSQAALVVPRFADHVEVTLPLPCSYDFEVAAASYLQGLRDGAVPVELLFRGTLFYEGADGALRTAMLPWDLEARYDLPATLWRQAIDRHFPASGWIRLSTELIDRLRAFKDERVIASWDGTVEDLLRAAGEPALEERR